MFSYKSDLIKDIFIFDFYNNREKEIIKLGFRIVFKSNEKTLTDIEVDKIMKNIFNNCSKIKNVEILGL